MGAKFFMCLVMIVLVVSPAYCAEWIVRVETGMEDGKRTPLEGRIFGNERVISMTRMISWVYPLCLKGYHKCDPSNCPGIQPGQICCCRNWERKAEK